MSLHQDEHIEGFHDIDGDIQHLRHQIQHEADRIRIVRSLHELSNRLALRKQQTEEVSHETERQCSDFLDIFDSLPQHLLDNNNRGSIEVQLAERGFRRMQRNYKDRSKRIASYMERIDRAWGPRWQSLVPNDRLAGVKSDHVPRALAKYAKEHTDTPFAIHVLEHSYHERRREGGSLARFEG